MLELITIAVPATIFFSLLGVYLYFKVNKSFVNTKKRREQRAAHNTKEKATRREQHEGDPHVNSGTERTSDKKEMPYHQTT